jgi:hypothetical protein
MARTPLSKADEEASNTRNIERSILRMALVKASSIDGRGESSLAGEHAVDKNRSVDDLQFEETMLVDLRHLDVSVLGSVAELDLVTTGNVLDGAG